MTRYEGLAMQLPTAAPAGALGAPGEFGRVDPAAEGIHGVLAAVRRHLGMDVAFISHFETEERAFEYVDCAPNGPLRANQRMPLSEGYCLKVVRGELPECIPDTSKLEAALQIPQTTAVPIGSHLSVPVRLKDGSIYGTLCCFSYLPNPALGEREMRLMHAFAEVVALRMDERSALQRARESAAREVRQAMAQGAPRIVFQPVYSIAQRAVRAFECLSRFDIAPKRPPDEWFRVADESGFGLPLELHAIEKALTSLDDFPAHCSLSVNCSPSLVLSGRLEPVLSALNTPSRVTLEITEHAIVQDYAALAAALAPLRALGIGVAVDDAGAGYASMRHILNLAPDIIKLDMSLTRNIHEDGKRRALAKGLTSFAHEIDSLVIAEGVESGAELEMLQRLDVDCAQGYFLARPLALQDALTFSMTH
ncbi:EAL domain-containing protein [uncultured Pseudacidovorax sp.]|uniref:sensor domain-containing phosphodiesterase n=1 Tax=uncultured Pseudacidovorax sp. TaxID=679313 RepID=UPI0025CE2856|nr:EAL domain-containing protein [uncultured Pseudacidovorax sp.]